MICTSLQFHIDIQRKLQFLGLSSHNPKSDAVSIKEASFRQEALD